MMSQARQRTKIESVPLLSGLCTLSGGDTAQPQGGSVQRAGASRWGTLRASWGITAPQEPPQRGGELSKVSHRPRTPPPRGSGGPACPSPAAASCGCRKGGSVCGQGNESQGRGTGVATGRGWAASGGGPWPCAFRPGRNSSLIPGPSGHGLGPGFPVA